MVASTTNVAGATRFECADSLFECLERLLLRSGIGVVAKAGHFIHPISYSNL